MNKSPLVGIVMGSKSDLPVLRLTIDKLKDLGIPYEVKVISAHRTPNIVSQYIIDAQSRGLKVIIAAAGGAAHLAGVIAGQTILPVIGIPIDATSLGGLDALLSTVQMPPGVPVATVAIGEFGAVNAAVLAGQILALDDKTITDRLMHMKEEMAHKVIVSSAEVESEL